MQRLFFMFLLVGCYVPAPQGPLSGEPHPDALIEPECVWVDVEDYPQQIVNLESDEVLCIDLGNSGDNGEVVAFFTLDMSSVTSCDEAGNCETPYSCNEISTSLVLEDLDTSETIEIGPSTGFHGCSFREMPVQPGRNLRLWHYAENEAADDLGYRVLIFVR